MSVDKNTLNISPSRESRDSFCDYDSVGSLMEDISRDSSDWTKHGMIQLLSLKNTFYNSITSLETRIRYCDRILKRLMFISAILTGVGMLFGFLILIVNDDENNQIGSHAGAIVLTIKIINVVIGFIGVVVSSWMNIGSYRKDILKAQDAKIK